MISFFLLGFTILAWFPLGCAAMSGQQEKTATVHLRIVNDATAEDLGAATVEVFERKHGDVASENFAHRFRENTASNIPYDFYRLCAHTTGFWTACTEVPVYQRDVQVVLGLRFGGLQNTEVLTGVVRNGSTTRSERWVRLVGIYSAFSADAKVDPTGKFQMHALPGRYVLLTIEGDRILDTRPIRLPTSGPVVIVLPRER